MIVRMINSVDEYVAGGIYDLAPETGDRFIILGYAEGELSRGYSDEESAAIQASHQGVSLDG